MAKVRKEEKESAQLFRGLLKRAHGQLKEFSSVVARSGKGAMGYTLQDEESYTQFAIDVAIAFPLLNPAEQNTLLLVCKKIHGVITNLGTPRLRRKRGA